MLPDDIVKSPYIFTAEIPSYVHATIEAGVCACTGSLYAIEKKIVRNNVASTDDSGNDRIPSSSDGSYLDKKDRSRHERDDDDDEYYDDDDDY
jgi:hypothetical protein